MFQSSYEHFYDIPIPATVRRPSSIEMAIIDGRYYQ